LRYKIVIYLADRQESWHGPAPVRRLRTTAVEHTGQEKFPRKTTCV